MLSGSVIACCEREQLDTFNARSVCSDSFLIDSVHSTIIRPVEEGFECFGISLADMHVKNSESGFDDFEIARVVVV